MIEHYVDGRSWADIASAYGTTQAAAKKEVSRALIRISSAMIAPPEIGVGMTIDQVTAAMGQPLRTASLADKKIYFYKDLKITFKDGKVIDVQ